MNLADAIRRAAQETGVPKFSEEGFRNRVSDSSSAAVIYRLPSTSEPIEAPISNLVGEDLDDLIEDPALIDEELTPQGFIRIEVHVPPEQLNRVLRSVVATQHSVLTLREAAHFLRLTPSRLEQLAVSKEVPAFMVDGKWRFSRAGLENLSAPSNLDREENS